MGWVGASLKDRGAHKGEVRRTASLILIFVTHQVRFTDGNCFAVAAKRIEEVKCTTEEITKIYRNGNTRKFEPVGIVNHLSRKGVHKRRVRDPMGILTSPFQEMGHLSTTSSYVFA